MLNLPRAWWLPLLALMLAWMALAALYYDTVAFMVGIWNRSETYAHAWVVPPISAWLVWRRRADLLVLAPSPSLGWLWLFAPLGVLWLLGELAVANAALQFALMGMIVLLVPLILGTEVARRIAFPLGFMFFAVPFGDFMTPWLIDRTADFTVLALRLSGIPVFREGTQFVIPTGAWSVVQACSGIRYMMASVMVGTLFAYINYRSYRKRWAFFIVSIGTPLVANWLRAYMIVMLGHLSGNTLAVGVDHLIYGWVFFGVIMLAMFMIGARWADPDPEQQPAPEGVVQRVASPAVLGVALLSSMLLVAVPPALQARLQSFDRPGAPALTVPAIAGWAWRDEPLTSWRPHFQNPAGELHGRFEPVTGGAAIGLYVGYYRNQRQGSQLVTSVNHFVDAETDKEWTQAASGTSEADVVDGPRRWRTSELRGQALSVVSGGGHEAPRLRVWQIYWIDGRPFVGDWQAKLYGAWRKLLGHGDDAAAVLLYADKAVAGPDDAMLREFLHANWATLDTALRGVRDRNVARQP